MTDPAEADTIDVSLPQVHTCPKCEKITPWYDMNYDRNDQPTVCRYCRPLTQSIFLKGIRG